MRQRLRSIIRKEFIQALRDPRMRSMLLIPPLLQLLIFGYAVNLDVDTANIAWMDQDNTPQSRDLRAAFEGSGLFTITATIPLAMQTAREEGRLKKGDLVLLASVGAGFTVGATLLRWTL